MKNIAFSNLEATMVRYRDLIRVPVADAGESLTVVLPNVIANGYIPPLTDMETIFGPNIVVRKSVCTRLVKAQTFLQQSSPSLALYITYGYRSLDVQKNRFLNKLSEISRKRFFQNPSDLYEEVNRCIAVPTVAGHPTGGAVDITIKNVTSDRFLDFGSKQYDYSTKNCYVFAPIDKVARNNRLLLRKVMLLAGFAPFDGEWWHFSYGDREWAFYYKKSKAIYGQLSLLQVKKLLKRSPTNTGS